MTEKEIVLKTVRELPDECSVDEIADRIGVPRSTPRWTQPTLMGALSLLLAGKFATAFAA